MRPRHLDGKGQPRYSNRLLREQSPYLIQHGHNPVDWYPWGDDAFARAREEGKPVFLSIGYATCHWCHVMEQESFENEPVAELLNRLFVPVKVDREQRPDIDEIYMTAVQLMTGSGGWPISCFLLGDGRPFYAGTYFPLSGFTRLLQQVSAAWNSNRPAIVASAERISAQIDLHTRAQTEMVEIGEEVILQAEQSLLSQLDPDCGGWGTEPKFPQEPRLMLLLDSVLRGDCDLSPGLVTTLDRMAEGGIYDQVGGGFHRYSVDRHWQIPHFEKMLYNQAQLAGVYSAAYSLSGRPAYGRVVEQTLGYLLREMMHPDGVFYAAMDADSEGREGAFFAWSIAEVRALLSPEEAALTVDLFAMSEGGNFEGKNILHLEGSLAGYADRRGMDLGDLQAWVDRLCGHLYRERERREHPLVDDKILTGWNGLVITALVAAAASLRMDSYLDAAVKAGEHLWHRCWSESGGLARMIFHGQVSGAGQLEDYACLSEAYLDLFDASGDGYWLERAVILSKRMIELFWDRDQGGFYLGPEPGEGPLIARPKAPMDGATASANSVALNALVKIHERNGDMESLRKVGETVQAFSGLIRTSPHAFPYLLLAMKRSLRGPVSPCQYAAGGAIRMTASADRDGLSADFILRLDIAPGWHITAADEASADLSPLTLTSGSDLWQMETVYPPAHSRQTGSDPQSRRMYIGSTLITGRMTIRDGEIPATDNPTLVLLLKLQACSEDLCMLPEQHEFRLPVAQRPRSVQPG